MSSVQDQVMAQTDSCNDKPNGNVEDQTRTAAVMALDGTASQSGDNERGSPRSIRSTACHVIHVIACQYYFPFLIMTAILVAWLYPPLGGDYLQPEITASWLAVAVIFLLSGIGIKTKDFSKALRHVYFNGFVQLFNFGVVSATVYAISKGLEAGNVLNQALVEGMVICASLPIAISVTMVLTTAAGGDEAAAVLNTALSNIIGIFLSPVLIMLYLGKSGNISLGKVFYQLTLRVIVPLIVGQFLHKFVKSVKEIYYKRKLFFKLLSEMCLVYIIYCVFCQTFNSDRARAPIGDIFIMIAFQFCLMSLMHTAAWFCLGVLFPNSPELRVCGFYGCVHKTVALGVPLINSIYPDSPNLALYTLPIMIWHPMQLVLGSLVAPRLKKFVESELERLKGGDEVSSDTEHDLEDPQSRSKQSSVDLTGLASSEVGTSAIGERTTD